MDETTPICPTLPSSESAYQAVTGEPIGWAKLVRDLVLRAALVRAGMYVYDPEDPYGWQRALAGSVGIELFVLAWTRLRVDQAQAPTASGIPLYFPYPLKLG